MNDHDARVVDWPAVLTRAHRRVALRLALAAGVGVVGAVLLLGGGSATRASIQDNAAPPPSKGPTDPGSEQPNLVIFAEVAEPAEGEEVAEEGSFTVVNESSIDAEEFEVVATAQSGSPPQPFSVPALAAGDSTDEFPFECPVGDDVVIEITGEEALGDPVTLECPTEPGGSTGPTGETGPTGLTGATGSTEPLEEPEEPESSELG